MEPLIVDNTKLSKVRSCKREAYYFIEEGLQKPVRPAPLNFGSVIHAGLAAFNKALPDIPIQLSERSKALQSAKESAMSIAIRSWEDQDMKGGKEWRTLDKAIETLDQILLEDITTPVISPAGDVLAEKDFAVPILKESDGRFVIINEKLTQAGYEGVLLCGIIDIVVEFMGQLYVKDYKTCSGLQGVKSKGEKKYIPNKWWDQFKPHAATAGYCYGGGFFFNKPLHGVMIAAIGLNRYGNEVIYEQRTFALTPEDIEEWRMDTLATIEEWLDCKLRGYFPRNPDACQGKYNSVCPYFDLCKVPASLRDQLKEQYEVREWNPLEARKQEAAKLGASKE